MDGYVDISALEIGRYMVELEKKKNCKVKPAGRFSISRIVGIRFGYLVCCPDDGMGGEATGTSAGSCENCKLKKGR